MCQLGGFENFFDAFVKGMMDKVSFVQMEQIMTDTEWRCWDRRSSL
jgi:hypothetical protein